jgi:YHS domain-containing protein
MIIFFIKMNILNIMVARMTTPDKNVLRDPVCAMLVQPDNPQRFTYKGQDFIFCSPRCLELFQNQPERYLEPSAEKPEKAPTTAETEGAPETHLTCRMHAEVMAPAPRCPKCGMFLERPEAQVEEEKPARASVVPGGDYTCPMHPRFVNPIPVPAPSAAWHWSPAP